MYFSRPTFLVLSFVFGLVSAAPSRFQNRHPQDIGESTEPPATPTVNPYQPGTNSSAPPSSTDYGPPAENTELSKLFPVPGFTQSWTTLESAENARPLDDSTLNPIKVLKNLTHDYVTVYGKRAMQAHYPANSYNFQHDPKGGFSFYAPGPFDVDLTTAKVATFGYSVFFPTGFEFQKGGKLPGIYGGDSPDQAFTCSGGRKDDTCFSARLMWRAEGAGELYTYLPPSFAANQQLCDIKPESFCNPTFGSSVGRGAFHFETGQWVIVSSRVQLNDVGQENGELELFVNGESVIKATGLVIRSNESGRMRGIQMQTFFGGSTPDFASPIDQDVFFSDFSVAIIQYL